MKTEKKKTRAEKGKNGRRRRWPKITGYAVGVLVVLFVLGLILLPFALEWAGEKYLMNAGAEKAIITNVDINPFTGRVAVLGLEVESKNGDRLSFDRLEADADILFLLKKRVRISNVTLTGLVADVRQSEKGTLSVGGLQATGSTAHPAAPEKKTHSNWGFGFGSVDLNDLLIHITAPGREETVAIKHLLLQDFATWEPENRTAFQVSGSALGADFQVDGKASPLAEKPTADIQYDVSKLPLEHLTPYIGKNSPASLAGNVDVSGKVALSLAPGSRSANLQASLSSAQVRADMKIGVDPILWRNENLSFQVNGSYSDTGTVDLDNISADISLDIDGISVQNGSNGENLLGIGSLEVKEAKTVGIEKATVNQISLNDITMLSRPKEAIKEKEPSHIVRLGNLTMSGVNLENRQLLHIQDVSLDSLKVWVLRNEGGELEPAKLIPVFSGQNKQKPSQKRGAGPGSPEQSMDISVSRISLSGENSITFRDLDVKPATTFKVDSLKTAVTDLDTDPSKGHASFSLEAGMGKYSTFQVDGSVEAPWSEPELSLKAKLRALDLPPLTPYTDRYLGYILKSGHLNTDMDITINRGKLDAQTKVVANRIEMDPIKQEDEQRANERLGIPVRTALSLLKDKDDDIKLNLPIEGDLNDPEFDISNIVLKVTGNALKKGVSTFYGPLGASILTGGLLPPGTFTLLGKVFQGVTAVSFDPVVFKPLESGLSDKQKQFLDQLAEKLSEKPKTRLILCGKVTRKDVMAMRGRDLAGNHEAGGNTAAGANNSSAAGPQELSTAPSGTAPPDTGERIQIPPAAPPTIEEVPLTENEKEKLIELAKQRAQTVRDYMVEAGGLDEKRVFVCYSDIELKKDGPPPRVDLSI